MIQPKYSPEEALQRIKLMMGYDSSKTLNENKSVIFEAKKVIPKKSVENQNPNILTDADLLGHTGKINQYFHQISDFGNVLGMPSILDIVGLNFANTLVGRRKGVKGAVDALDGFVDSKDLAYVLTLIKLLDGKCYYDDVEGNNVPAIVRFLELYKEDEGDDLSDDVNGVGTRTLPTGTDKIKQKIVKEIEIQKSKSCDATVKTDDKKDDGKEVVKKRGGSGYKSTYTPCTPGKYVRGCKSEVVRKVQACLKQAPKHQTGNFGPITQGNLQKLGKGFENGFTDADVATICQTETVKKLGNDVESQTLGKNQNDVDSNNQQDLTTKTGIN